MLLLNALSDKHRYNQIFIYRTSTMPSSTGNGFSDIRRCLLKVQDVLGDIDSWPSRILNHIFIDEYDRPNSTANVAFFYGNRVLLAEALCFYTNYNDHNPLMTIIHFTLLYRSWETSPVDDVPACDCTYYNVRLKKMQKLHFPQPESSAADEVIHFGIDATGNGERIRQTIAQVFV